jgi:hypothetical protein
MAEREWQTPKGETSMRFTFDEWWNVEGYKPINQGFVDAAGTAIIKKIAANTWAASQEATDL